MIMLCCVTPSITYITFHAAVAATINHPKPFSLSNNHLKFSIIIIIRKMDPCQFVRILVGNLAIKSIHPSSSSTCSFFSHIKLKGHSSHRHVATVPLISDDTPHSVAASFDFTKSQIDKFLLNSNNNNLHLNISVYKNPTTPSCAFRKPKLLGIITLPLHLTLPESRIFHNGWLPLSHHHHNNNTTDHLLHFTVRAEPDPRFVFRFDSEPECSPQVFQVRGDVKQPVFTCKFSFRDRNNPAQAPFQPSVNSSNQLAERKGWSITVHDLSGSPVAAASMVTPFVPSPGSQRVSRSNPGAWLIIRPDGDGTWKPWGRLEAWREPNNTEAVGYRFEVGERVTVAGSTISSRHGGEFRIDVTSGVTPVSSPEGSRDFGYELGFDEEMMYKGFVMSAKVEGERKCSKPVVEVGVKHVSCTEDAAAFVALAAAMDLSMDACKLFSHKLRKELRRQS